MGTTITPAAMQVVNMVFAEKTLTQIKQMPALEQTQVMCDLVKTTWIPPSAANVFRLWDECQTGLLVSAQRMDGTGHSGPHSQRLQTFSPRPLRS